MPTIAFIVVDLPAFIVPTMVNTNSSFSSFSSSSDKMLISFSSFFLERVSLLSSMFRSIFFVFCKSVKTSISRLLILFASSRKRQILSSLDEVLLGSAVSLFLRELCFFSSLF